MNDVYGRDTKDYYLSGRLLQELEKILDYPLTVIEAPSGAGKTTAVREYLKEYIPQSVNEYWYTAIGETPARVWEYIYDAFYPFDSETAEALKYLGTPARETLGDIARLLKSCRCEAPTVLVIDNYQLIQSDIQREIISALSYNGSSNLHIVIITQELDLPAPGSTYNSRILTIGKDTLFFTARGEGKGSGESLSSFISGPTR
ncbi:AAA domain-containing protein [Alkalibaculum bacchi]|uniref:AAA domain-containing protein n=1 Tax=Alkalibaculum bacchi TaxID=645887 RepID=A0A366I9X1_9FIRM|nr:AAA family ATPase [Alkalibaculum bacchi]RBP66752.1 AAA domain-containing protein [Alkalibaculum bacchi]